MLPSSEVYQSVVKMSSENVTKVEQKCTKKCANSMQYTMYESMVLLGFQVQNSMGKYQCFQVWKHGNVQKCTVTTHSFLYTVITLIFLFWLCTVPVMLDSGRGKDNGGVSHDSMIVDWIPVNRLFKGRWRSYV